MSTTKLAFQLLAASNYIDALGGVSQSYRQALASYEAEPAEGFVTSADSLTTQLRGYAVAVADEQPYWADKIKAACDELDAAPAAPAPAEPVAWAISYDGKTPYALWDYGEGALLDLEVKRLGGTASKMPLYAAPVAPAPEQQAEPYTYERQKAAFEVWAKRLGLRLDRWRIHPDFCDQAEAETWAAWQAWKDSPGHCVD
jgi:hypothetical protein